MKLVVVTGASFGEDIVEKLQAFAQARGHTMLELAFSWLASRPQVSSVIAGATRVEQVEQNVKAIEWKLSAEEMARLAAAKADGHIDAAEQANIFAQMDRMNVSAEDKAFVMGELRKPLDLLHGTRAQRRLHQQNEIAPFACESFQQAIGDKTRKPGYEQRFSIRHRIP